MEKGLTHILWAVLLSLPFTSNVKTTIPNVIVFGDKAFSRLLGNEDESLVGLVAG